MKTTYIKTLYEDFNTKLSTIYKYLKILDKQTDDTTRFISEYVALHEQVYDIIQRNKAVMKKTSSEFAIEPDTSTPASPVDNSTIKEISAKINEMTPAIQYHFEQLLKNQQFLTQSYQNYQDLTNSIIEAWTDALTLNE